MAYKDARTLTSKGPAVFETLTLNAAYVTYFFFSSYLDKLALLSIRLSENLDKGVSWIH